MKKIFIILVTVAALCSCEEFLTVYPENNISSEEFPSSEKDMELYANGFINSFLPGSTALAFGDQYADNIATRNSTTFLINDTWRPEQQGGWAAGDWAPLRNVNWYLDNIGKAKKNVSEAVYNHYEGVGRFWRAWFYYNMVRTFGDVPWYNHVLEADDEAQLYKPRDSREIVMDKILEDLNFAVQHCSTDARMVTSSTRVTRWVALAFKARICLFEGTYRKYHTELNLTSSSRKFLDEAAGACEILMNESPYGLVTGGDVKTQYRSLFISDNLNEKEVIFGAAYKSGVRMHDLTWISFSGSAGSQWSLTKQMVNQYLMLDGTRFTDKTGYATMAYKDEFTNRDYRLSQTVIGPEYKRKMSGTERLLAPQFSVTLTGYEMIKWALDDNVHDGKSTSANSLPVFRFGEVLLNYAEAKAEMGTLDEQAWNKTVRLLRERAGVNGAVPSAYDPYLAAYYQNQTTDKWILEVRRERAVEMASEQVRYDDLMRWKMGKLIELPWQGIYIGALDTPYDLNGDGTADLTVSNTGSASITRVVLGSSYRLSNGTSGYLEYGYGINRQWSDRKYLHPVPTNARQVNPALGQNPGWE